MSTTESSTHTVTILDLSQFNIVSVDWKVKYLSENTTMVQATLSLNSSIVISNYFSNA